MKGKKLFNNLKVSTKLNAMQVSSIFALALLLGVIHFSITMLSALRATVGAQGLWEKHQKLAHTSLITYVYSGNELHYQNFREAEKIVNVYEKLRNEFLNGMPNHDYAFNLMVEGGIRSEDVPPILFLFKHFLFISHRELAMTYWGNTHPLFVVQDSLATSLHDHFTFAPAKFENRNKEEILAQIEAINAELTYQGTKFSETIGVGSRWMEGLVFKILIIGSLLLGIFLIYVLCLIFSQIKHWILKLNKGAKAVSRGELDYRIHVNENHELAMLAGEFNNMTQSISELISENKSIEVHLRDLSLVASESDNVIFICDKNGYVEWVNDAFSKLSGYNNEDVIGTHAEMLSANNEMTGLDPRSDRFKSMVAEEKSVRYETKNHTKDGNPYWIITTLSPVYDDNGVLSKLIAMDVDITKIKESEITLQKAKELAEASEKTKQLFLANMSHEIRTPMNAIIGFTELLEGTQLNPQQKESLEAIRSSGENLLVLINDILDFAKIEANQVHFEAIPFKINRIAEAACHLFKPKAMLKNLNCILKRTDNIPPYLIGDPYRLNQIIVNLLSNAIKFTNKGSVEFSITSNKIDEQNISLCLEFKDTGIGIPLDKQPTIFSHFTQASSGITRKYGGTGLGLSIVKQLIDQQKGTIHLDSEERVGSTFSVCIPYRIATTEEAESYESKLLAKNVKEPYSNKNEGIRILIVEDNPVNQLLATRVLTKFGYVIDMAENGKIAVEKTKARMFDLILMDLQMPELDGFQATNAIREPENQNNATPIIAMTAHVLTGEKERCVEGGMDDYISKPFAAKALNKMILSYVNPFLLTQNDSENG